MYEGLTSDLERWMVRYKVRQTLKATPDKTVEVVFRVAGADAEPLGPLIRKTIHNLECKSPYEEILRFQVEDRLFAHEPFIYEYEREGSTLTVIMQYLEGPDLTEVVESSGGSVKLVERIMPDLLDAISELHEGLGRPIVHGAIRPTNVLIVGDTVMLLGLSCQSNQVTGGNDEDVYVAPEVSRGRPIGVEADVYAAGMVCAYLCWGTHPTADLVDRNFDVWRIPASLAEVLTMACDADERRRFTSARAFKAALVKALGIQIETAQSEGTRRPFASGGTDRRSKGTDAFQDKDVASEDDAKPVQEELSLKDVLGITWDVVLGSFLLLVYASGIVVTLGRIPDDTFPAWALIMVLIFGYLVPVTVLAYVLAYKRPFRRFMGRLAGISKKLEVLYAVLAIVCSITMAMLAVFVTGALHVFG